MRCLLLTWVLVGCGSTPTSVSQPMADPDDPAYAASLEGPSDSRVSRSRGSEGGVVVLWPRVIEGAEAEAPIVQARMQQVAERVVAASLVDLRPEPERVCPQGGCLAASIGAVIRRNEDGCAVIASVSGPGTTPARLVPWAGTIELRNTNVPFREAPEQHIRIREFVPCAELVDALAGGEAEVEAAIRDAVN
jgi:hypothetical protein